MEIKNAVFEKLLTNNNLKKTDFAQYSKIPYNTVVGWKKKEYVPAYAMVILKDMIYRKKLDIQTEQNLKKTNKVQNINYSLTTSEKNSLSSLFWGTKSEEHTSELK